MKQTHELSRGDHFKRPHAPLNDQGGLKLIDPVPFGADKPLQHHTRSDRETTDRLYVRFAADYDDSVSTRLRSHTYHDGAFEQEFDVDPPGLFGLSRLAHKLNNLEQSGQIHHWALGRWKNRDRTRFGILFGSVRELNRARLAIQ